MIKEILILDSYFFFTEASNSSSPEGKVIGGEDTFPGEIRYLAYFSQDEKFVSNAFMISESAALIPAHFLHSFWLNCPPPDFGRFYIVAKGYDDGPNDEQRKIEQVEHISQYNSMGTNTDLSFDIAVVKVD